MVKEQSQVIVVEGDTQKPPNAADAADASVTVMTVDDDDSVRE